MRNGAHEILEISDETKRRAAPPSLDFSKHNRNKICGGLAWMGPVSGPDGERAGYAGVYCKAWDCPYCGPRKAARLGRLIEVSAKEHGLNRFLALTLDPQKCSSDEDLLWYLRLVWRKLRVYVKRRYGKTVPFTAVVEEHKSGIPHRMV